MADEVNIDALPEGDFAICFKPRLTMEMVEAIRASVSRALSGRRFLILDGEATVVPLQSQALQRIEHKLDALIVALAAEEEAEDQPQLDLDGAPAGAARTEGTPL